MANDILVKVGADISDYSRKMSESSRSLSGFTKANQQTFDAFKKTGAVVTGAGVALAGGLGVSVKYAANFESAMSSVAAISGATGKDFELLSDKAREMGASTSFSATEAAEGLEYMALAGWDTQQMLGGIGPILHLAEAGALELGRASDLVTDSMSALGLEVSDLDGYLDKIAKTAASANTDIDALMEAFVIAGGTFSRFNVPLEEANAFLGVMANRGFKGSEAGTALNAIMTRLTASTGPSAKALKELGINAFDSEGNFRGMEVVLKDVEKKLSTLTDEERAHYQTQIAGLNHGKAFSAMLSGLGNEYDDLKGKVEDSDGALIEMRNTMKDNLQGALENLSSAFEEIMISLGTALLPAVKTIVEWLQKLADWFNGLSDNTKTFIAVGAAVASVLMVVGGGLLLLIGFIPNIVSGFKTIRTVMLGVRAAMVAMNTAFLANPIVLIVAVIIAAIAGLAYLIYKYWDKIKKFSLKVWNAIVDFMSGLWDRVKENWAIFVEWISNMWEGIKETAVSIWESIVDTVMAIVQPFIDGILNLYENMKEGISTIFEGVKMYFEGIWDLIKNIFLGAVLLLINLVTGNFEELKKNAMAIWDNIKDAFGKIWDGIKLIFEGALDAIWGFIKGAWDNIKTNTKAAFKWVSDTISSIWDGIKRFFTETLSNIWTTIKNKFTDIVNSARDKMNEAKQKIEDAWDNAVKFLKDIDLKQIGKDIIQGLINGIKSKINDVANAVKDVTDQITGKIKSILGIKSPSRVLKKFGEWTTEGFAIGIEDKVGLVARATEKIAEAATPDAPAISLAYDTPAGVRSSLASAVSGTVDVNARDNIIATAISRLERKLTNLEVVMDERIVGRIVEPHVTEQQVRNKHVINRFRE